MGSRQTRKEWTSGARKRAAAGIAMLALWGSLAQAQNVPSPGPYPGPYDAQRWGAGPQGYAVYAREEPGQPRLGARQGWVAGVAQGQSDRELGHSFRPTHVSTYKHVPDCPSNYAKGLFKQEYRDAFLRGYEQGYGR